MIKLTLISGILGLEQQFPGGALSIQQLRQLVERGGAQLVVERTLPGLQRQILGLQTNLDAVFDKLAVEVRWSDTAVAKEAGQCECFHLQTCSHPCHHIPRHMLSHTHQNLTVHSFGVSLLPAATASSCSAHNAAAAC